jgi:hypothetical protein
VTIAEKWEMYKATVWVRKNVTPEQMESVREVFYCGAASLFSALFFDGEERNDLLQEIQDFKKEMRTP